MARRKIPEFLMEQMALGEATERTRSGLTRELGAEEIGRRVEGLRRSDEEILARYPVQDMAARIRERLGAADAAAEPAAPQAMPRAVPRIVRFPTVARRLTIPLAVAAVALLAVVAVPRIAQELGRPAYDGIKGRPTLLVYRQDGNDAVLLPNGARAAQGDHIQIRYMSGGYAYGAIVSVDGRGNVTLHYPASPRESTALAAEGAALDYAYVLDDAPEYERFFLVASQSEFPATVALGAAEKLAKANARRGELDLPRGFEQMSLLLSKGED